MEQNISVIEQDGLRLHVYSSKLVILQMTSVVIEGPDEVALVDAQFSVDNASAVAGIIRSTGKPLTTIYISTFVPDTYFGLDTIVSAFPDARIIATPQTVWLINATKDNKWNIWIPQLAKLGAGLVPKRLIVPDSFSGDHFTVSGKRVEIKQLPGDEEHAHLWIPSTRTVLGSNYIIANEHVWAADSQLKSDRTKWIAALDAMDALGPDMAIPSHFKPAKPGMPSVINTGAIEFTRSYLEKLETVLARTTTPAEVIARMKALYPDLPGEDALETTAKVLKGESPWKVVQAFPPIARQIEVDFGGEYHFKLDFKDERTMTFRALKERGGGRLMTDTVQYTAIEIAPLVYLVYWTEADNTHVVQIQDYGQGVVWTNIAAPDSSFTNLKGTLKLLP